MKHVSRLFAAVLVLSLLAACGGQPAAPGTPTTSTPATAETPDASAAPGAPTTAAEPAALRIVTSFQIDSLDPSEDGFWMPEFGVAEMLTQFRQDGKYYPWLLESYANSDDLTWKLTLRPNLTFQSGKPVDAEAVVACIERQMEHSSSAQGAIPEGTTFEASGEREITVKTAKPFPSLPGVLANESIFMIYDAAAVDAVGEQWEKLADAGIYTGPYRIVSL
ncbi:MAG: hypothetical protein HGA45_36440, partial [Chloroflexales bacterium]|nr:hypothetical protein [Chloroflexales bacterium]